MKKQENYIREQLTNELRPFFLHIENESYKHNVPDDAESHFKVIVVSNNFTKLSLIKRHRFINELLGEKFFQSVHALSLHLFDENEWKKENISNIQTPDCQHK